MVFVSGGGWGGNVLKEKLKMIKVALREWHQSYTHNIPGKFFSVKERISCGMKKGRSILWEM